MAELRGPAHRLLLACMASLLTLVGCADMPMTALSVGTATSGSTINRSTRAGEVRLRMKHLHTGESIDVAYRAGTRPIPAGIRMLNHFLRDWRTGQDAHYPIQEFDLLHALMERLHRRSGLIEIVCGYRSVTTNRMLRAGSSHSGVAEGSEHTFSRAIDLRVPGVSTERVRDAALALQMGGVGYYPQSGFVHVDVGPVRQWSFDRPLRAKSAHVRVLRRRGRKR